MCSSAYNFREDEPLISETGTELVSERLEESPVAALILPSLAGVPAALPIVHHKDWWTRLALTMLDAGILNPAAQYVSADVSGMVCAGFDTWLQARLTGLRMVGFRIALAATLAHAIGVDEEALQVPVLVAARPGAPLTDSEEIYFLSLKPQDWNFVSLKAGFEALDACCDGLGETLWYHIEQWLWALGLSPVTPSRTEWLVSTMRWYGEADEKVMAEDNYSSIEEYVEDGGLTRAAFDEQMPACVVNAKKRLSWAKIEKLANGEALPSNCRRLVGLVVRYHSTFKSWNRSVFSSEGICDALQGAEQISPSVFIRWTEDDLTTEIFDEFAHGYQCGDDMYFEGAEGFDCLRLDDALSLRRWMKSAEKYLRAVRMVDQMLSIFEDFNNEYA